MPYTYYGNAYYAGQRLLGWDDWSNVKFSWNKGDEMPSKVINNPTFTSFNADASGLFLWTLNVPDWN